MAQMIPATMTPGYRLEAEERVFDALKRQLGHLYVVFHSFDVTAKNRDNRLIDVEIDFLILSPLQGILILEVKGGQVAYDGSVGEWRQNGVLMHRDPFRQAKENKYAIKTYLESCLKAPLNMTLGHAVCFPDVFDEFDALPANASPEIILTGAMLPYIQEFVESTLSHYRQEHVNQQASSQDRAIKTALMPVFEFATTLADRIGQAKRTTVTLTERQCELLDFLGGRRRVKVQGCAGSGKTLLALKKSEQLAATGLKVLLLCYNNLLAERLTKSLSNIEERVVVTSFHNFCLSELQRLGGAVTMRETDHLFWQRELPQMLLDQLEKTPIHFDAIVVDEGQDFTEEYWLCVEELLPNNGHLFIFYDPDQNLYSTSLAIPIGDAPFVLSQNCRNTKTIVRLARDYCTGEMTPHDRLPEGDPVTIITYSSSRQCTSEIARILHQIVNEQGIPEDRVVILGAHSLEKTSLGGECKVGNFAIRADVSERPPKRGTIRYFTYMKFKGCEADVVLLLDIDQSDSRWRSPMAFYSAVTRAKFSLILLQRTPDFARTST